MTPDPERLKALFSTDPEGPIVALRREAERDYELDPVVRAIFANIDEMHEHTGTSGQRPQE